MPIQTLEPVEILGRFYRLTHFQPKVQLALTHRWGKVLLPAIGHAVGGVKAELGEGGSALDVLDSTIRAVQLDGNQIAQALYGLADVPQDLILDTLATTSVDVGRDGQGQPVLANCKAQFDLVFAGSDFPALYLVLAYILQEHYRPLWHAAAGRLSGVLAALKPPKRSA